MKQKAKKQATGKSRSVKSTKSTKSAGRSRDMNFNNEDSDTLQGRSSGRGMGDRQEQYGRDRSGQYNQERSGQYGRDNDDYPRYGNGENYGRGQSDRSGGWEQGDRSFGPQRGYDDGYAGGRSGGGYNPRQEQSFQEQNHQGNRHPSYYDEGDNYDGNRRYSQGDRRYDVGQGYSGEAGYSDQQMGGRRNGRDFGARGGNMNQGRSGRQSDR